ncbi:MAG: hypothetical protein EDM05_005740 [Leptolyngbya sp. IPPAS B-1204]|nr:MAG: hypothetical protein EDM05_08820 [Leptolyngbya sp. IPPAS B-1204]
MLKTHLQPIVAFLFQSPNHPNQTQVSDRHQQPASDQVDREYSHPMIDYYFVNAESNGTSQANSDRSDYWQPMTGYYFVDANQLDTNQPARSEQSVTKSPKWATFFSHLWHSLVTPNTDPRVEQQIDRSGQPLWQVYDPMSDRHHTFYSEEDVYQWLERRYYE